jgi:hypothetical protein
VNNTAIDLPSSITGISLLDSQFRVHETYKNIDIEKVYEVLNGDLTAYRIRDFVPSEESERIVANFQKTKERKPRYGLGNDGVEAYLIGASHIEKTTLEYLQEAKGFENAVKDLYKGTKSPLSLFRNSLVFENSEFTKIRPAELRNMIASESKAVMWNNGGEYLLLPHDDIAQLSDPMQNGFEIQKASRVMAINFYAHVPENAGELKVWNIEPDDDSRHALGLEHSGYPYPLESLSNFDSLTIPVKSGDLCVINGNLVHAVLKGSKGSFPKSRLLITCFLTFNNLKELIWWT